MGRGGEMCFREGKVCKDGEEYNKCDFPLRHNANPFLLGLGEKASNSNYTSLLVPHKGIQAAMPSTQKLVAKAYHLDDDSEHLQTSYYVPGTVQNALNVISNLVLIITL